MLLAVAKTWLSTLSLEDPVAVQLKILTKAFEEQKWAEWPVLAARADAEFERLDFLAAKARLGVLKALFGTLVGELASAEKSLRAARHLLGHEFGVVDAMTPEMIALTQAHFDLKAGRLLTASEILENIKLSEVSEIPVEWNRFAIGWKSCLQTEVFLQLEQEQPSRDALQKLSENSDHALWQHKRELLSAQLEFVFAGTCPAVEEWSELLKALFLAGYPEFALDRLRDITQIFRSRYPLSSFDALTKLSETWIKHIAKKFPDPARVALLKRYAVVSPNSEVTSPYRMLQRVLEVTRGLLAEEDVFALARKILRIMIDQVHFDSGLIILRRGDETDVAATVGLSAEKIRQPGTLEAGFKNLAEAVTRTQKAIFLSRGRLTQDKNLRLPLSVVATQSQFAAYNTVIALPFVEEGKTQCVGAVCLVSRSRKILSESPEAIFLENFSINVAMAVRHAEQISHKESALRRAHLEIESHRDHNRSLSANLNFVGHSEKARALLTTIEKIADTSVGVLLTGESGSGKEMAARLIHHGSSRRNREFVAINCGAIPENLLESELFGYKRGAFTDAHEDKPGLIMAANGGTLFLDEIGELPLVMQAKILRFLEEREVTPLGGHETIKVDVRVIGATNVDLEKQIATGKFRRDLYYRLNVIGITMPALRERKEDIPLLIYQALERYAQENATEAKTVAPEALQDLVAYPWPGNVRELVNAMYNLSIFVEGSKIERADLLARSELFLHPQIATDKPADDFDGLNQRLDHGELTLSDAKQEFEKLQIARCLTECGGNITTASKRLGMPRPQVSRLVKKYGLKISEAGNA